VAERTAAADATRERILKAAIQEFGAKGYAGARTAGIAARAGVNQQLISYYFGGKRGLLEELRQRWSATDTELAASDVSFVDTAIGYLGATLDNPDWARLYIRQALGDAEEQGRAEPPPERLRASLGRIRRAQQEGQLGDAFEPEFILLTAYLLAFAPIALPHVVAGIFGDDPGHVKYRRRCAEHLALLATQRSAT